MTIRKILAAGYHDALANPESHVAFVNWTINALNEFEAVHGKADTIVFRGQSGAAVAYPVAFMLGRAITYIKKCNESSHSKSSIMGVSECDTYVIIDDFVDTGYTIREIMHHMGEAKCLGIFLYRDHYFMTGNAPKYNFGVPVIYKNAHRHRCLSEEVW